MSEPRGRSARRLPARTAALLAAVAAAAAACGPQYQTFTSYTPPADGPGRQCLAQCLSQRQLCRQSSGVEVRQCRLDAQQEAQAENLLRAGVYQIELQRYQAGLRPDAPEAPATARPGYGACDARAGALEGRCTADHDLCYQSCGGTVAYTTHCVANCE